MLPFCIENHPDLMLNRQNLGKKQALNSAKLKTAILQF